MSDAPARVSPAGEAAVPDWSDWLATPAGAYLLAWERRQLASEVANLFGYYAVQLGFLGLDALEANRMPSRVRVGLARCDLATGADLMVAHFDELPFDAQSIDLVVLPHHLEFCADPHQVLREIDRILRPEGRLIVLGFNPLSFWGLAQAAARGPITPVLPARPDLIGAPRLRDWLKLLGYDVGDSQFGCFAPAFRTAVWFERMRLLDRAGDRWWPILGASYLMTAVKRVRGLRVIGPSWRRRVPRAAPAVAANRGGLQPLPMPVEPGRHRPSAIVLPMRRRG